MLSMVLGFFLASRLPVAAIVAITIALELFVLYMIRDNLTLNTLMLIYPLETVKHRQAAV